MLLLVMFSLLVFLLVFLVLLEVVLVVLALLLKTFLFPVVLWHVGFMGDCFYYSILYKKSQRSAVPTPTKSTSRKY